MYFFALFFPQNLGIVSEEGRGMAAREKCPQYPIVRVILSRHCLAMVGKYCLV